GHHAAADDDDALAVLLLERLQYLGKDRHVCAGQKTDAQHVDVLLHRGERHLPGGTVKSGGDHVHPGIAQRPRNDLDAAVVAIEPDLGQHDADLWGTRRCHVPVPLDLICLCVWLPLTTASLS